MAASSSSASAADDRGFRRDLELYRKYPAAMGLIEKESAVYLEHKKDDPEGTLIYPIVESHKPKSATAEASSLEDQLARKMEQLTLLAALHAEDDNPMRIFRARDHPFAIYPSLNRFFRADTKRQKIEGESERIPLREAVGYLEECLDLAEYVQLPKPLCERLQVAICGERYRALVSAGRETHSTVDRYAKLREIADRARDMMKQKALNEIGEEAVAKIRFEVVFGYQQFVSGACNVPVIALQGGLDMDFEDIVLERAVYHIGRVVGGHPLVEEELAKLKQLAARIGMTLATAVPIEEMDVAALSGNVGGVRQLIAAGFPVPSLYK